MSEEKTALYRVKGIDIRHQGKIVPIGKKIALSDAAADRLSAYLEPLDQDDSAGFHNEVLNTAAERISELEAERFRLDALLDERNAAICERDTTIAELNNRLAELNNQLAELQKQLAAKGGKK